MNLKARLTKLEESTPLMQQNIAGVIFREPYESTEAAFKRQKADIKDRGKYIVVKFISAKPKAAFV